MSNNNLYLKLAPKLNKTTVIRGTEPPGIFNFSVTIPSPAIQTIVFPSYLTARAGKITTIQNIKTDFGSLTCSLVVDGIAVTGFPTTINTVAQTVSVNVTINIGSIVQLVISGVSAATNLQFLILGNNT